MATRSSHTRQPSGFFLNLLVVFSLLLSTVNLALASPPTPPAPTPTAYPTPPATPAPPPTPPAPPELPDEAEIQLPPGLQGTLASPDGRVSVHVPAGALAQATGLKYRLLGPVDLPSGRHLFRRFELSAWPAGHPNLPPPAFNHPTTITVTYDITDVQGLVEETLRLVTWDEDQGDWVPIAAALDTSARQLTAELPHFSEYAVEGDEEPAFFQPRVDASQVNLGAGTASFSYELDVPAGAGGMKLPLTLSYNSSIPNGMFHGPYGDDNSDTGWVGVGWTLEIGTIEKENLTFNSLSGQLIRMPGDLYRQNGSVTDWDDLSDDGGYWTRRQHRLQDEEFARIESYRYLDGKTITGLGQWDIWTKDGTHYVFGSQGYNPPDQPMESGSGSRLYTTSFDTRVYEVWKLDTITDTHGNVLKVDYAVFPKEGNTSLKESYPRWITYTTNPAAGDMQAEYGIEFVLEPKDVDVKSEKPLAETGYILREVRVWFNPGPQQQLVRKYLLDYYDLDDPDYYLLHTITQLGPSGEQLPSVTFDYTDFQIGSRTNGECLLDGCGEWKTAVRPFLTEIQNGYGGSASFGYETWTCYDYADGGEVGGELSTCAGPGGTRQAWSQRLRVQRKTLSAGNGDLPLIVDYTYGQADVRWTTNGYAPPAALDGGCRGIQDEDDKYLKCFEEFISFEQVTENWKECTDPPACSQTPTRKKTETALYDCQGRPKEDRKKGKVIDTLVRDANNKKYSETITEYGDYGGAAVGWPATVHFIYVSQVTERSYTQGNQYQSKKTVYHYDQRLQNYCGSPGQYGNVTRVEEYGSETASDPYRTQVTAYCPNETDWIVDRAAIQNLYSGSVNPGTVDPGACSSDECLSSAWSVYSDDQDTPLSNWNQTPGSKGELRGSRQYSAEANGFVDTLYRHDLLGNATSQTVYNSYGTAGAWASADPRTTTTAYDDVSFTFPVLVTNTLDQTTVTEYYGLNETEPASGRGLPGQAKGTRDANEQWTWYQYDPFGRPVYTWLPGDDAWNTGAASTVITYEVDLPLDLPTWKHIATRDDVEPGGHLESWRFYDGLGRLIQTQAESAAVDEFIVTNRGYDSLGQVMTDTLPYTATGTIGAYQAPEWNRPSTLYQYDALGRTIGVTNPDGTQAHSAYRGWDSAALDENGRQMVYRNDALGRLVSVSEYSATLAAPDFAAEVYAYTTYVYDKRDNLVTVYDANAHDENGALLPTPPYSTTMQYDMLGRKTDMDDPNMGQWQYVYDALGNLVEQTDAKGQKVCMGYDALNRPESKSYLPTGGACCDPYVDPWCADVGFSYDQGEHGIGRRTGMFDQTGATTWEYDARGQVVHESKMIAGGLNNPYVTEYGYDALGRVITMTYPSEEVVTTSYDAQGLPLATAGDAPYVTASAYNPQGQVSRFDLGNGAAITYLYYGESGAPASPSYRLWQVRTFTETDFLRLEYTYDDVGNVESITDFLDGSSQVQHFVYDALDRLTHAWTTGGSPGAYDQVFAYDQIGNMTAFDGLPYGYGQADGIAPGARPHAVTHVGGEAQYDYDDNGNMIHRYGGLVGWLSELTWDEENRLVGAADYATGFETDFSYDGDGNLVRKISPEGYTIYIGNYYEEFVDTVPPFVAEMTPTMGAAGVPVTTSLQARFSEPVHPPAPLDEAFRLYLDPATLVTGTVTLLHTDAQTVGVQFDPGADLLTCHVYTATIDGFEDLPGNAMDAFHWKFMTADILPRVEATHLASAAVGQRLAATLTVTMTEEVTCPADDCLQVIPAGEGEPLTGTLSVDGRVASLTTFLEECTVYTVTVIGLADLDCGEANVPHAWTFTTQGIPPRLTASDPAAGQQSVPLDQVITLTFDEPVDCPQGNCVRVIKTASQSLIPVYGSLVVEGNRAFFTPYGGLEESTLHGVTASGFKDQACGVTSSTESWQFETVHVPPQVVDHYPASGAACVPLDTAAWVRFDEPVEPVPPLTFTLAVDSQPPEEVGGDSGYIRPRACLNGLDCEWAIGAVFTPSSALTEDLWYRGDVSGPHDAYGNQLTPFNWQFKSDDLTPPRVDDTEPADRVVDVYPDEPLTAWFDDWLSASGMVIVHPLQGMQVDGSVSLVGRQGPIDTSLHPTGVRFTPDVDLAPQVQYVATISGTVDECGNTMSGSYTWQFVTACFLGAGSAPTMTATSCDEAGVEVQSSAIAGAAQYEWLVTEAPDPWGTGANTPTEIVTTTGRSLAVDLPYPGTGTLIQARGRGASGCITHWSEPIELTWESCYPGAPLVTAVSPPDATQGVSITAGVVVTFSEVVHVGSVCTTPVLSLLGAGQQVTGTMQVALAYDDSWAWSVRFVPTSPLAEKTAYQAVVTGATDSHGRVMTATHEWGFSTGDYTPPSVAATEPPAGGFGQVTTTTVVAYFDEPLTEPGLGSEVSFELAGPRGPVPGMVTYEDTAPQGQGATPWLLRFTPGVRLETDGVYTATLEGATDLSGNVMAIPHTWWFATQSTQPFVVASTEPEAGAVAVPSTATVTITFSKRLLAGSEGSVSFELFPADGSTQEPVDGQLSLDGSSLRFVPAEPFDAGRVYQVRVVGATSFLGDRQLDPYHWAFEVFDPEPPTVTRAEPKDGETEVALDTAVTIYFDKALKVGGQDLEFTLVGPDGNVAGYLEWVQGDELGETILGWNSAGQYQGYRAMRFRPLQPLEAGKAYEATVKGVETVSDVPMAEPYSWSFTVGYGAGIDVVVAEATTYYYHYGQRVAMRQTGATVEDVVYWLVGDHLGTTSLVLDEDGCTVAESRHLPYGGVRWSEGKIPTDYRFAGQFFEEDLNIYRMGARWYDGSLGRWFSPDSIVPDPTNPQSLNRFSYVKNNPVLYRDSSGHMEDTGEDQGGLPAPVVDPDDYVVVLVGLDEIPWFLSDGMGIIYVNYTRGFGTLPAIDAPNRAAIVYYAPTIKLPLRPETSVYSTSLWKGVDDLDLQARIVAQETTDPVEQIGVASVVENRITQWKRDRRSVLLGSDQFAFNLPSTPEASNNAVERWADPLHPDGDAGLYRSALTVTVGASQGWLRDATAGATYCWGDGTVQWFTKGDGKPYQANKYPALQSFHPRSY